MVTRIYPYLLALYMFIYDRVGSVDRDLRVARLVYTRTMSSA
jgi:hypothetical protein